MGNAWIVDAVRTPTGKRGGCLASLHAIELGALPLRGLVARTGIDPADLDDVVYGCTSAVGELGSNVGRLCALEAGFPVSVTGVQVNRLEASSDQALHVAVMGVRSGMQHLVCAGGVASASRVPLGSDRVLHGAMADWPQDLSWRFTLIPSGCSADLVARRYGLERTALDAYAVRSHRRAATAHEAGHTEAELVPVSLPGGRGIRRDEGIRPDLSVEILRRMPPAFGAGGRHTAGTTAPLADGAAALLVASDEALQRFGLEPVARVVSVAVVGVDPTLALTGPPPAAHSALSQAGITLSDLDAIEIQETFAGVALGCVQALGLDPELVNGFGGALATGHPGGAAGAHRLTTLLNVLSARGGRYGLLLAAVGFGQASATVIERVSP